MCTTSFGHCGLLVLLLRTVISYFGAHQCLASCVYISMGRRDSGTRMCLAARNCRFGETWCASRRVGIGASARCGLEPKAACGVLRDSGALVVLVFIVGH